MLAVYKRELRAYFSSATGFVFMGFFLLIAGFFFAMINLFRASPNYNAVLGEITFIFLIVVPILTMRLMSEEAGRKPTSYFSLALLSFRILFLANISRLLQYF